MFAGLLVDLSLRLRDHDVMHGKTRTEAKVGVCLHRTAILRIVVLLDPPHPVAISFFGSVLHVEGGLVQGAAAMEDELPPPMMFVIDRDVPDHRRAAGSETALEAADRACIWHDEIADPDRLAVRVGDRPGGKQSNT